MEFIITTLISVSSVVLTVYSTIVTIRYSSKYHVKKNGKAKEKYLVTEKISHGTKEGFIDSSRIVLCKSSLNNAMGFMDVSLTKNAESVIVDRYSFIHSFIHNIYAPGKIILENKKQWTEKAPSNLFMDYTISSKIIDPKIAEQLVNKKIKRKATQYKVVESRFSFPSTYTGPRYKKRTIVIAKGIGIAYSKTEYINKDVDIYSLSKYQVKNGCDYWLPVNKVGNKWIYDISYEHGSNKLNLCE